MIVNLVWFNNDGRNYSKVHLTVTKILSPKKGCVSILLLCRITFCGKEFWSNTKSSVLVDTLGCDCKSTNHFLSRISSDYGVCFWKFSVCRVTNIGQRRTTADCRNQWCVKPGVFVLEFFPSRKWFFPSACCCTQSSISKFNPYCKRQITDEKTGQKTRLWVRYLTSLHVERSFSEGNSSGKTSSLKVKVLCKLSYLSSNRSINHGEKRAKWEIIRVSV